MPQTNVLAVATCRSAPTATADDAIGLARLALWSDVVVETVPWDAPPQWHRYVAVVIRSTWDYHTRRDSFLRWTEDVEAAGAQLWNPASVVAWNTEKRYLEELAEAGVSVIPTEWIPRGSCPDVSALCRGRRWSRVVVKPSIAATAYRTACFAAGDEADRDDLLSAILTDCDAMIQPFLPEITHLGEWSFIYFDDGCSLLEFSHAVVKRARPGDFRVQPQYGGTARVASPSPALRTQVDRVAEAVRRLAPGPLLYARIDGVVSTGEHAPDGTFLLMEAELVEPMLFLAQCELGADRFAAAVARRMGLNGRGRE